MHLGCLFPGVWALDLALFLSAALCARLYRSRREMTVDVSGTGHSAAHWARQADFFADAAERTRISGEGTKLATLAVFAELRALRLSSGPVDPALALQALRVA